MDQYKNARTAIPYVCFIALTFDRSLGRYLNTWPVDKGRYLNTLPVAEGRYLNTWPR